MSQEIQIIDPSLDGRIARLRKPRATVEVSGKKLPVELDELGLKELYEALTRKKTVAIPETGVKLVAERNYENLIVDVDEQGVYVIQTQPVLLRATIYAICTVAGGAGTLRPTLSWTARTKQPSPPAQTFFPPTDVDLTVYGDVQYGEVLFVGEGPVTFKAEITGGAGSPEYSAYLRIEKIGL